MQAIPRPVTVRSVIPTQGLKKTHAMPSVKVEIVPPITNAKMKAATLTTEARSQPTSGIQARTAMIGAKRR